MKCDYLFISARGAAPLVLACIVALPVALLLAASNRPHGRGPTWGELFGPLGDLHWPDWITARYGFAWPVRRGIDRVYGLLLTEAEEVVLVRHDRHEQRPYHTLPGGTIQPADGSPADVTSHTLGAAARRVENWSLIHVEQKGRHQELVYAGVLRSADLDLARTATPRHLMAIALKSEDLLHLDLHPHGVAEVLRGVAARHREPA